MANTSYVQLPPDGAGKKVYTNQITISGNTYHVQGVNMVSGDDPSNFIKIDSKGAAYTRYNEGSPILATYGDLKVLQEKILGVYEHTIDSYDDLYTIITVSGGTSTFEPTQSSVVLSVNNTVNSKCSRVTNRHHYYQPGTSFLAIMAVSCGDTGKVNNKREWGLYNHDCGLFFQLSGTSMNIARLTENGTEIFPQSEWSDDKLDGTGDSGIVLNVTTAYQYFISINYPVNAVTFGIYDSIKGRIICHRVSISGTVPFPLLRTVSLPFTFNNENIGVTSGSSELREIAAVIKVEGMADYTFWRYGDLGCNSKPATTNTPILSVRAKALLDNGVHNHINSFPEVLSVFASGSTVKINIVEHDGDILSGGTWTINSVDGPLEGDIEAVSIDHTADSYWIMRTFYVPKDSSINYDLTSMYELNDEGILLGAETQNQVVSFVATTLDGASAEVTMDLSYRALY